ncbi:MAG: T9SS type A sorting domain-containing protein, partial [Bacteroidota bacterium]|nr:T9SS type A sorting domain-containing protein [Bacteroidota bacterium]
LPKTWAEHMEFYNTLQGGDHSTGHAVNPSTGLPYDPQVVPRGDYTRVLAEFWADGPESETPPGHWFTILNYVSDHSLFEKRMGGEGPVINGLDWDVKAYLALGGAMHDCAVAIWSIKGYYDYIRPISAIRYMTDKNHIDASSGFSEYGIPLVPDFIETVEPGDPLAGPENENVGKIKLYTWRGHEYVADPSKDIAGAGWILAENWWPYQRPSFVTPPFAGYVSGHSGFSRAAAEVMTLLTGSEYFPGGMGEFHAPKNDFLQFEAGPSVDVTLQWATYRDASDQTSLSRIWGGIHAPVDDIKARIIGEKIGVQAFIKANQYYTGLITSIDEEQYQLKNPIKLYPNPVSRGEEITIEIVPDAKVYSLKVINLLGQTVKTQYYNEIPASGKIQFNTDQLPEGLYLINIEYNSHTYPSLKLVIR